MINKFKGDFMELNIEEERAILDLKELTNNIANNRLFSILNPKIKLDFNSILQGFLLIMKEKNLGTFKSLNCSDNCLIIIFENYLMNIIDTTPLDEFKEIGKRFTYVMSFFFPLYHTIYYNKNNQRIYYDSNLKPCSLKQYIHDMIYHFLCHIDYVMSSR